MPIKLGAFTNRLRPKQPLTLRMIRLPLLVTLLTLAAMSLQSQEFERLTYGPEPRQFVDIYLADSDCPTPVYFDAHANDGTTNMPRAIVEDLTAAGISIVAWESLTSVSTPAEVETGWADAELMFAWVKANAATYNFDTTNFIIGGSSRGSILSWKYGHTPDPNIKGLYLYNALPDGAWADTSWWYPPNDVSVDSPPIFFVYRYEPGVAFDTHDPENGLLIMDTYEALGIGDRDTLIHSIGYSDNTDRYQFLVEFAQSVLTACQVVSVDKFSDPALSYTVFPNPFQDQLHIVGLQGEEYFRLTTVSGALIEQATRLALLPVASLPPGIYFLTIERSGQRQLLKLVKQ